MIQDEILAKFKLSQKEGWSHFAPLETITTIPAHSLIEHAKLRSGQKVLDVGCGTGVTSVTAARIGCKTFGLDLSPALLERAQWNATTAGLEISFKEGDVESLPYHDEEFDAVISQFGHMFAPRPEVAISEMLRVLKPGGVIAFSTWPPEMFTGQMFSLVARFMPPPEGVAPPPLWGDISIIRERLGKAVRDIHFDRQVLIKPSLSPQHSLLQFESTAAPLIKLNAVLSKEDPAKLAAFRQEFERLITSYTKGNCIEQHFLMTRAYKA